MDADVRIDHDGTEATMGADRSARVKATTDSGTARGRGRVVEPRRLRGPRRCASEGYQATMVRLDMRLGIIAARRPDVRTSCAVDPGRATDALLAAIRSWFDRASDACANRPDHAIGTTCLKAEAWPAAAPMRQPSPKTTGQRSGSSALLSDFA